MEAGKTPPTTTTTTEKKTEQVKDNDLPTDSPYMATGCNSHGGSVSDKEGDDDKGKERELKEDEDRYG
jgi:hypothetical protein